MIKVVIKVMIRVMIKVMIMIRGGPGLGPGPPLIMTLIMTLIMINNTLVLGRVLAPAGFNMLARKGAAHHLRQMQCQDELAALGSLAWLLRRRWGMTALRENARLKIDRLGFVGRGTAAAAYRRHRNAAAHTARARAAEPRRRR